LSYIKLEGATGSFRNAIMFPHEKSLGLSKESRLTVLSVVNLKAKHAFTPITPTELISLTTPFHYALRVMPQKRHDYGKKNKASHEHQPPIRPS